MFFHSKQNRYGAAGIEIGEKFSGTFVMPNGIPMSVVTAIEMRIEPGTFIIYRTIVIIRPITATIAVLCDISKLTNPIRVPVSLLTIPAFARPIIVINKPIPTATAFFNPAGIELIIASRIPKNERRIKIKPSAKTAVSANCHVQFIAITTV